MSTVLALALGVSIIGVDGLDAAGTAQIADTIGPLTLQTLAQLGRRRKLRRRSMNPGRRPRPAGPS